MSAAYDTETELDRLMLTPVEDLLGVSVFPCQPTLKLEPDFDVVVTPPLKCS